MGKENETGQVSDLCGGTHDYSTRVLQFWNIDTSISQRCLYSMKYSFIKLGDSREINVS